MLGDEVVSTSDVCAHLTCSCALFPVLALFCAPLHTGYVQWGVYLPLFVGVDRGHFGFGFAVSFVFYFRL